MSGRSGLGALDVSDAHLATMAALALDESPDEVTLLDSSAVEHPYALDALTTSGRHWVTGSLQTPRGARTFRLFVKHVEAFSRSARAHLVPAEHRADVDASIPWATEPAVYRSALAASLPAGLSMPRALHVEDLDSHSAAIWLAEVPAEEHRWTTAELERAAYLLGRFAANPGVQAQATAQRTPTIRAYAEGRLRHQIVPALHDEGLAQHPLIAGAFSPELIDQLRAASDRLPAFVEELEGTPVGASHGDACPNNLLVHPSSADITLIDFGFFGLQPLGFDLTQLLVGEVQLGRRPTAALAADDAATLPAYARGLRDEGAADLPDELLRRAHALLMLLFCGLSAYPFELLQQPPTPEALALTRERAAMASFILDLVDATEA